MLCVAVLFTRQYGYCNNKFAMPVSSPVAATRQRAAAGRTETINGIKKIERTPHRKVYGQAVDCFLFFAR